MGMILLPSVLLGIAVATAEKEATAAMRIRMKPFSRACLIFAVLVFLAFAIPPLFGRP